MMDGALGMFKLAATVCGTNSGALPNLYKGLDCSVDNVPQFHGLSDIFIVIANVVQILIAISGSLAIITILVASIFYITATGDPARTKRAREIIQNTVTGLIVIILAYAIVGFAAAQL
jgi:hypothetical protein